MHEQFGARLQGKKVEFRLFLPDRTVFDYNNVCVQQFIRDVCLYWLDTFALDGMRFDYSLSLFRKRDPNLDIAKLISDIKKHLADSGRTNVALILEHLTDNRFDSIDDTNQACATNNWFDPFMFRHFEYVHHGNIDRQLLRILDANRDYFAGKGHVTYIQNHDHSTVDYEAGGRRRFLPGSGNGRVVARLLQWSNQSPESGDFTGQRLYDLYSQLIRICIEHPALRSTNFFPPLFNHPDGYSAFSDRDVVVFNRYGSATGYFERFIIVINYSDFDQRVDIPFSLNGLWDDLLNGDSVSAQHFRLLDQEIKSNWTRIYHRQD